MRQHTVMWHHTHVFFMAVHANTYTAIKKTAGEQLTELQKEYKAAAILTITWPEPQSLWPSPPAKGFGKVTSQVDGKSLHKRPWEMLPSLQDPCKQVHRSNTHKETNKGAYFDCVVYKHRHAWTRACHKHIHTHIQVLQSLAKEPDSSWCNSKLVISGMVLGVCGWVKPDRQTIVWDLTHFLIRKKKRIQHSLWPSCLFPASKNSINVYEFARCNFVAQEKTRGKTEGRGLFFIFIVHCV